MPLAEVGGLCCAAGQELKEIFEQGSVEGEVRGKLPEDGAEFWSEEQQPGGEEVCERLFDVAQTEHVSDIARALYAEEEVRRGELAPAEKAEGPLQAVEGAVDLNGGEALGGVGELARMW